jgi:hypothetical protein
MGDRFFKGDIPRIADALERIAKAMEKANELKEKERGIQKTPSEIAKEFVMKG